MLEVRKTKKKMFCDTRRLSMQAQSSKGNENARNRFLSLITQVTWKGATDIYRKLELSISFSNKNEILEVDVTFRN